MVSGSHFYSYGIDRSTRRLKITGESNIEEKVDIGYPGIDFTSTGLDVGEGGSYVVDEQGNNIVEYFNAGIYDVTLTVSDGVNSDTLTIENYIIVNTCTNVKENFNQLAINLFPNPFEGMVTIGFTYVSGEVVFKVLNMNGLIVYKRILEPINGKYFNIDLSDLPKGIYLCELKTNHESSRQSKKLIKLE